MSQVSHSPRLAPALVARSAALLAVCGWLTLATQAGPASAQARQALTPAQHRVATSAGAAAPLNASDFSVSAPEGFGDRQNGWAWAMNWWKGQLYVGTNRAFHCVEAQSLAITVFATYPPTDTDTTCTQNYADLPLQAELWRWTPGADISAPGTWERVYQSPNDIPNPDPTLTTTHYLPEDIAYRGLATWTPDPAQPDNQYLFASGVSAKPLVGKATAGTLLQPRLLYTQDGTHWTAITPTASGVPVDGNCYRGAVSIINPATGKPRFFIVTCTLQGSGQVLATDTPLDPNSYKMISSALQVFEIVSYNNALYVGTKDDQNGYSVLKADPAQSLSAPWTYRTVMPSGAGLSINNFNTDVVSMKVYKGWLFIGGSGVPTNVPAEMVRIDPWDNWDVVHGPTRPTPAGTVVSPLTGSDGTKYALTGLGGGFGEYFNQHMWRMTAFDDPSVGDGRLYVGTYDSSTPLQKNNTPQRALLHSNMGFGLYSTADGWYFNNVTDTGFDEMFNMGVRNMASTPYGLFVGSANYYYGTHIYRGVPAAAAPALAAPQHVEINTLCAGSPVLAWDATAGAASYQVSRARLASIQLPATPSSPPVTAYYPLTSTVVATTTSPGYLDASAVPGQRYLYTVAAADGAGQVSAPSNRAEWPSRGAPIVADATANPTYPQLGLLQAVQGWQQQGRFTSPDTYSSTVQALTQTSQLLQSGTEADRAQALATLAALRTNVAAGGVLEPLAASDLSILIDKLSREQLSLSGAGAGCPSPTPPPSATPTASSTPTVDLTQTSATPVPTTDQSTATATSTAPSVSSSRCTATISSTTPAVTLGIFPTFHDSVNITGMGFLANEQVHLYFNAATPFGGPQQGSNAVMVTADATGSFAATALALLNPLAVPNQRYPIVAQGDSGSCAPAIAVIVPGTLLPVEPLRNLDTAFGAPSGVSTPDNGLVSAAQQTVVISSSRIMSDATSLAAAIDTAAQDNYSGAPDAFRALFGISQKQPVAVAMVALPALSGPTWGVFSLTLPATLSFNVHSIVLTGTNQTTVRNISSIGNTYTLPAGQVQHDATGMRYVQTAPAAITLDTTSDPAQSSVTVRGTGFAGSAPLSVALTSAGTTVTPTDSVALSSAPDGSFSYTLTIPAVAPGPLTITVSDPSTTYATAPYTVLTDNGQTATPTPTVTATLTIGATDTPIAMATSTPTLTPSALTGLTWSPATVGGSASDLYGIACTAPLSCYAVGTRGSLLRTTDGSTFAPVALTSTQQLNSVICVASSTCFAVGRGGTIMTNASGSWTGVGSGTTRDLWGISCPNISRCYVAEGDGEILVTSDGGHTWSSPTTPFSTNLPPAPLFGVTCPGLDDLTCQAVGGPAKRSLYTTDGGTTWNYQSDYLTYDKVTLLNVTCPATTICYAVGTDNPLAVTRGVIRQSTDGGRHWTSGPSTTVGVQALYGVSCPAAMTCYATGDGGTLLSTSDGGQAWTPQSVTPPTSANLRTVTCPSAVRCYAVGFSNTILIGVPATAPSPTPSATANPVTTPTPTVTLTSVATATPTPSATATMTATPSATATASPLPTSTTEPLTWNIQTSGTTADLTSVACSSATACYTVGAAGALLRSTDGGVTWMPGATVPTARRLNGAACSHLGVCYAVGDGGTLLGSLDGANWTAIEAQTDGQDLTSVTCSPSGKWCFAATRSGKVLVGDLAQHTWTLKSTPFFSSANPTVPFYGIACVSDVTCYAVGGPAAQLLYTHDRGDTWHAQDGVPLTPGPPGADDPVYTSITCPVTLLCYATGADSARSMGRIVMTADGGHSWIELLTTDQPLFGIACTDVFTCYAVGAQGTILQTTSGGFNLSLGTGAGMVGWTPVNVATVADARGIVCPAANRCYVVGDGGTIITATTPSPACPLGTGAITTYSYLINGSTSVASLRGNVHQGDTVQPFFTIAPGCTAVQVSIAAYTVTTTTISLSMLLQQRLVSSSTGTFDPGLHHLDPIQIPSCQFQLDFARGPVVQQFGLTAPDSNYLGRLIDGAISGTDVCGASTPTPTPTDTPVPLTATSAPTLQPSQTSSMTPTPTPTVTETSTSIPSNTPEATSTQTSSPTPTISSTAAVDVTATPTATAGVTVTPPPTGTQTATPTVSTGTSVPTGTPTPDVTGTPTSTVSPGLTASPTPSLTAMATASETSGPTLTPTATASSPPVPSTTPTLIVVPTLVPTATPTMTMSPTALPSNTPTTVVVPTDQPTTTATPLSSATSLPTAPIASPTATLVIVTTSTPTILVSATPTIASVATETSVSTATQGASDQPIATATVVAQPPTPPSGRLATSTIEATATEAPQDTPTSSATETPVPTNTTEAPQDTPTSPATETPVPTNTTEVATPESHADSGVADAFATSAVQATQTAVALAAQLNAQSTQQAATNRRAAAFALTAVAHSTASARYRTATPTTSAEPTQISETATPVPLATMPAAADTATTAVTVADLAAVATAEPTATAAVVAQTKAPATLKAVVPQRFPDTGMGASGSSGPADAVSWIASVGLLASLLILGRRWRRRQFRK